MNAGKGLIIGGKPIAMDFYYLLGRCVGGVGGGGDIYQVLVRSNALQTLQLNDEISSCLKENPDNINGLYFKA